MDRVDTDILIDIQRGHAPAVAWFAGLTELPFVPGFVVMELIQDARNAHGFRRAWRLVAPFQVIWPSEADCDRALSDFSTLHSSHALGLMDAHCCMCYRSIRDPLQVQRQAFRRCSRFDPQSALHSMTQRVLRQSSRSRG